MASNIGEALEHAGALILEAVKTEIKETIITLREEETAKKQLRGRITADYYVATGKDVSSELGTYLTCKIGQGWETYNQHGKDMRVAYRYAINELEQIKSPLVLFGVSHTLDQTVIDYVAKKRGELEEKLKQLS